jgi:Sigma-70 region 2
MTEREQLLGELRPVAFAIAYRMLGSVSEAEDVVQEALLRGRDRVARTVINYFRLVASIPGVSMRYVEVNGGPGAVYFDPQQRVIGVVALDIAGGQITGINGIVNPDKLAHLGPVADYASLLRSAR